MFTITVDADRVIAKMDARKVAIPEAMGKVVEALTAKLLAAVMARAPVKTGRLRQNIFSEVKTNESQALGRVFVAPFVPYARFVEYGTKPHDIYPSKAQALRFMVGGKAVFAAHVKHPGTMARLYVHGPFEELKPEIVAKIEAAMREAIK